jgi:hypothetical protein
LSLSILHRRRRPRRRDLAPGCYLTDGQRLFYVIGAFATPGSLLVALEDCATLDRLAYTDSELEAMRLRRVSAAGDSPATPRPPAAERAGLGGPDLIRDGAPPSPPGRVTRHA